LAQGFEEDDGNGIGEVEGTEVGAHGDGERLRGMGIKEGLGQASGFGAENEEIARLITGLQIAAAGFCGAKPDAVRRAEAGNFLPILVQLKVQMFPIIQSGPFERFVREQESAGLDDVENCSRAHAKPADIACVGWNLRFIEDHVQVC